MTLTDFPREDLAPLRHQQVRALLVREAGSVTASRRRVARRAAPAVAALAITTVGAALALPGTTLGDRVGAVAAGALERITGDDPVLCGSQRPPSERDDLSAVRYLPAGRAPDSMLLSVAGLCVGFIGPAVPAPIDDAWDTQPRWSVADVDADGTVRRVLTVWRSLPPGVSADVADGRSTRSATDAGDPGTVLDPPYRRVTLRGREGTLVRATSGLTRGPALTWTEADGRRWSVTGVGVADDDVLTFAQALRIEGGAAEPTRSAIVPSWTARGATAPAGEAWWRLDVPSADDRRPPDGPAPVEAPWLRATFGAPTADDVLSFEANTGAFPWQAGLAVGDRVVTLDGGTPAVVRLADREEPSLQWTLPSRVDATVVGGQDVERLVALADSVEPVPDGDPRLTPTESLSDPGVPPTGP